MVDKLIKPVSGKKIQEKINEVIDTMTAGGVTIDDTLSSTSENPVQNKVVTSELSKKVENKATNASSVSILGNGNANDNSVNIGTGSTGVAYSVAVGYNAVGQNYGTAVGYNSNATTGAIQLGAGTNSTQNTFKVKSWEMLNASGKIPDDRINTTIARTSQIPDISVKQDTITGGASTITSNNLTTSRVLISNSSGKVAVSSITSTKLDYLSDVTSNIQSQLNGKANTSGLAKVATSGSYNDLTNKPSIPTVPTNISAFTNDAGYLTQHQDISGKQDTITITYDL